MMCWMIMKLVDLVLHSRASGDAFRLRLTGSVVQPRSD